MAAVDFWVCQLCGNLVSGRCWSLGKVGEKLLTKCLFSVPLNWSHPSVPAQKLGSVASDHMHSLLLGTGSARLPPGSVDWVFYGDTTTSRPTRTLWGMLIESLHPEWL